MIKRLIKSIRRQPKGTRDNIALGIAGAFTAVVLTVWLYQMPARNSILTARNDADDASKPGFTELFGKIGEQFASVKEAVNDDGTEAGGESGEAHSAAVGGSEVNPNQASTTSANPNKEFVPLMIINATSSAFASSAASESYASSQRPVRIVTSSESSSTATSTANSQ